MNRSLDALIQRDCNNFGVVRLFAATAVIVSHAFILSRRSELADPLASLTSFSLGGHAVNAFFLLSGFLIAASWDRQPNLIHFLCGRYLRIFPALIVVTITTIAIAAVAQNQLSLQAFLTSWETISLFLRAVVALDGGGTLPGIFVENPDERYVLATVWTIRYEVICYLTIPLVSALGIYFGGSKKIVGVILALSAIVLIIRSNQNAGLLVDHFARFFFAFYIGVASWMFRKHLSVSFLRTAFAISASFLLLGTPVSPVTEILAVACLTFWIGSVDFGWFGKLTNREDLSYGIYLLGFPIQQMWLVLWSGPYPVLMNVILTLLTVSPLAFLSWRLIERPALNHRSSLQKLLVSMQRKAVGDVASGMNFNRSSH
ncbi:acyltransferase [Labrenzia sp. PHM005]|uniref:acyltransferase family protein n=1 Tax=Labrenzia sp. PHM005 TaxID=2590016 RepID=UPI00114049A9|nr:acyltransferase [Labrenzia sp. PHM005]QDG77327.1 acyltransferase [Labrenzia sp. PHM005]